MDNESLVLLWRELNTPKWKEINHSQDMKKTVHGLAMQVPSAKILAYS